ncbi:MAG: hypothetical protein ACREFQ_10980 [Stellaceae bacterium]
MAPANWIMVVCAVATAFGINGLYTLGYTITQDAVASASMSGIGIATGMAGGLGYLFAVFSGPAVGAHPGDRSTLGNERGGDRLRAARGSLRLLFP